MKKIYLDNCCFNRPFDNQWQIRIRLETEAKLYIQSQILENKLELIWSYILDFENNANPFEERRKTIINWRENANQYITANEKLLQMAREFTNQGIKSKDALHLACAISGKANYFITTDAKFLKRAKTIPGIGALSPLEFINEEDI